MTFSCITVFNYLALVQHVFMKVDLVITVGLGTHVPANVSALWSTLTTVFETQLLVVATALYYHITKMST